ncbi:MAG: hypothetical protein AAGG08_08075 [Actinomycetota bacterium]
MSHRRPLGPAGQHSPATPGAGDLLVGGLVARPGQFSRLDLCRLALDRSARLARVGVADPLSAPAGSIVAFVDLLATARLDLRAEILLFDAGAGRPYAVSVDRALRSVSTHLRLSSNGAPSSARIELVSPLLVGRDHSSLEVTSVTAVTFGAFTGWDR